ncbi:class II aldolase/adducin family protein [candidate division GN15 bacterium]|nr:class II aldolase/adducin family protein [candidate division GN15 bacterium]
MQTSLTEAQQLIDAGRRLDTKGFIAGTDGNLSARCEDGAILITPSGRPKGQLTPDDLVTVSVDGTVVDGSGKPSSEIAMHLLAYRRRPDCRACVHSHPPHATAFAVAGRELPSDILPEVVVFVGRIPLAEYAPPGTEAVPSSLEPFIAEHNAFLLRNHGLLTIGTTVEEALHRHETVEHFARILWLALQVGEPGRIPPDDLARLNQLRDRLADKKEPS